MERTSIEKLQARMWITERCHMRAEKRNRFLEYYFHITLALFALGSIFIALFQRTPNVAGFENALTFTSICTLSISLIIFGFAFGETAAKHRSCYLDLQRLHLDEALEETGLNVKYINTLAYYPNHSTSDYMHVTISNVFAQTQKLTDPSGNPFYFSWFSRLKYATSWIAYLFLAIALTSSPVAMALISIGII